MNENRIILSAFFASVVLHLVLVVVLWRVPLELDIAVPTGQEPRWEDVTVEILPTEPAEEAENSLPDRFTLVPERMAQDEAPEDPDYASLFHSRAMDRETGSDGDVPKAAREGDFEQVAIQKDDLSGGDGVAVMREALPVPRPRGERAVTEQTNPVQADQGDPANASGERPRGAGDWALPVERPAPRHMEDTQEDDSAGETAAEAKRDPVEKWWSEQAPSILREQTGNPGDRGFDFDQLEQGRAGVGVSFVGDYSLNTYEWNYAPWMKTFMSQLQRHWKAPYAYSYLGMIHGQTLLQVVVARDGRLKSLEILDGSGHQKTEGHGSLHEASEAAMRAFAPYAPLPAGFPEDELVMTWRLIYPQLRR
ncbi:hypothetical protein CSB20_06570 [bacterium DOLZORAL124_64_63]|nr:MAG: hypothetical protein CSB20_06570 [bacterium DOLZORAL124_64_63]